MLNEAELHWFETLVKYLNHEQQNEAEEGNE